MTKDPRLVRLDPTRLRVLNDHGVDATLFANEQVPIESGAVDELVGMVAVRGTAERLADHDPALFDGPPALAKVAVTPDFHKGVGIPIGTVMATAGFVVPQAIGNDINCGMRLHLTPLRADQVVGRLDELEARCRHLYFEGGRDIPMTRGQRQAMLTEGLPGLMNAVPSTHRDGIWSLFNELRSDGDLERVHQGGALRASRTYELDDYLGPADGANRDGQIGSIGGGNHFVEIQRVARIIDGATAHAWGLREGQVTVMVHSGSLSIGHHCGTRVRDMLRKVFPAGVRHPDNGIFLIPDGDRHRDVSDRFWDALGNAANFAFANRLMLALLAVRGLREVVGGSGFDAPLLYDAPHNLVWREELDGRPVYLHRKGACPARGFDAMAGTPFAYYGEPVLVPGSMGSSSFVLAGRGNPDALWSASHGAGRALSRGDALRASDAAFEQFLREFRVVTPVDLRRPDVRMRRDIVQKKLEDIKKEAPFAYKGIGPIVNTLADAGIARPVAELTPLMTVKG